MPLEGSEVWRSDWVFGFLPKRPTRCCTRPETCFFNAFTSSSSEAKKSVSINANARYSNCVHRNLTCLMMFVIAVGIDRVGFAFEPRNNHFCTIRTVISCCKVRKCEGTSTTHLCETGIENNLLYVYCSAGKRRQKSNRSSSTYTV